MQKNEIQTTLLNLQENLSNVLSHTGEAIEQAHTADLSLQKDHIKELETLHVQIDQMQRLFISELNTFHQTTLARFAALITELSSITDRQSMIAERMEKP